MVVRTASGGLINSERRKHLFLHGREYRGSTRTGNRTLATRIAEKRKVEVLEGRTGLRRRSVPKLSKFIPEYTEWTAKTNRTACKDAGVLAGFVASVGDQRLDEVSPFHIERWKTLRVKEVQPATVNRELNIIRGCFSRAVEWGHLTLSPVRGVKPYRVENTRTRILSSEEIQRVLDGSSGDLRLIARATLESLFRLSEALNLQREDIGPTFATVVYGKNGRMRHVPLTAELRSDLLQRAHTSGWIFGEDRYEGQPPTQSAVTIAFCRLMRRLNVQGASHHTLRHTGASAMVAAGVSLRVVQEIGGWTSLRMLERYAHPTGEEMQKAVRVLREQQTGTKTGTAVRATHRPSNSERRQRVVGLEDDGGVPNGIRTRVSALKGPYPGPLDDGDEEGIEGSKYSARAGRLCGVMRPARDAARALRRS